MKLPLDGFPLKYPAGLPDGMNAQLGPPPKQIVDDIVRQIVEIADPDQVILFGSGARGEFGPRSDLDFMVVKEVDNTLEMSKRIYLGLHQTQVAVDVVVVTP